MRVSLIFLLVLLGGWRSLTWVHDRNEAVHTGMQAYARREFGRAAQAFRQALAVEKTSRPPEGILLNLAHTSTLAGQLPAARAYYSRLLNSPTPTVRSVAHQQLAIIHAQRGEYAQAVRLLRLALVANPANAAARYNYEMVSRFLKRQPDPTIPPPAPDKSEAPKPKPSSEKKSDEQQPSQQPKPKPGQDRPGEANDADQPENPNQPPQPRLNAQGQPNAQQPGNPAGNSAKGGMKPGAGPEKEMAQGQQPGNTRGLSNATEPGTNAGAGTENAAADATQLQTQRARLQQMQLSPAQARQILDALRASEQQYIQQLPRKAPPTESSSKPAW
ncbi:tetratricopeptide repeat protein [Hymenobacter sp. BT730]|uniref:tetratricopeptide repeat protein n=1 Tax=Hymenobacter sp. BT730 TaxID=3063332 RepID=UPI0026DEFF5D|nr:tetratricopeptide repeat protein [Hymenobacter sp. BT730]